LVQEKVDGKIRTSGHFIRWKRSSILTIEKVKKRHNKNNQKKRTTSQLVFAAGLNNVVRWSVENLILDI
jgi:hypothetical protein